MSPPGPPADIAGRTPLTYRVRTGTELSRFYSKVYAPIYFDRSSSGRLNAPDGKYGVLYAALRREGSFAESFLRRTGSTLIATDFMAARAHVSIGAIESLKLAKLFGNGLARLGATAEVTHSGPPYLIPPLWSAALHDHKAGFDGIAYSSRHNDKEICVALYERCAAKIAEASRDEDLDQAWFYRLANHHGVGIAP